MSKLNRELSFLLGNHCAKPESIRSDVFNNLSAQVALLPRLLESIYFLCILPPEKWILGVPVWDSRTWKHRIVTCRQERKKQNSPRGIMYQAVLSVVLEVFASFWAWTEQCNGWLCASLVSQWDPHTSGCELSCWPECGCGVSTDHLDSTQPEFLTTLLPSVKCMLRTLEPHCRWRVKNWSLKSHLQGENPSAGKV